MITIAIQIAVVVLLTLLNGLFAMSETALVSSRKTRLKQHAEDGDRGAATALALAEEPTRFLSTVQIGISLIGVLAGAFGGATLAEPLAGVLSGVPLLAPYAAPIAFAIVVASITYLSLIIGELVPKKPRPERPRGRGLPDGAPHALSVVPILPCGVAAHHLDEGGPEDARRAARMIRR